MAKETTVYRLDEEAYNALERSFPTPFVTDQTTDIQAGFQLGVQAVLKRIREGVPVERDKVSH